MLFLAGCSVTIDSVEDPTEQHLEDQPVKNDDQVIEEVDPELQQQQLFAFFGGLLPFNPEDELYYLALGDSLTRGVGDGKDQYGFSGRLADELEQLPNISTVEFDNRGKNGRRSDQLLKLVESGHYDAELENADLVTISLGGNDVMKVVKSDVFNLKQSMFDKALSPFKKRYTKIIEEIRVHNADVPIILVGFYNPFAIITDETAAFEGILESWNDTIEEIANNDINACFVPVADLFVSNDSLIYHTDFFHPNANGYERMAKRVVKQMQKCNIESMSDGLIVFEE